MKKIKERRRGGEEEGRRGRKMEEERGGRREMERRGGRGACIEKRESGGTIPTLM